MFTSPSICHPQSLFIIPLTLIQVKSTQSREVTAIVNHFNLQVNNPCAIMTQETSKVGGESEREWDIFSCYECEVGLECERKKDGEERVRG